MPEQGMVGVRCPVSNPKPLAKGRILPCGISYDSTILPELKHQAHMGFGLRSMPLAICIVRLRMAMNACHW